jgi:hypothetical protein
MKEGRDLIQEALSDAKTLKQAAMETARNQLIEQLTPGVRKLLDESIRKSLNERGSKIVHGDDGPPQEPNGTKEQKKDYVESANPGLALEDALQELFPAEGIEEKTMKKSSKKSSVKEAVSAKSSKKSSVKEEIEISEQELRKVYEAALQTEVQVKKGFSDIVGGGELDQAHKETGIQDAPKTKHFEEAEVPHKQKWIPEAKQMHAILQKGLAENKALRENLRKAVTMIETLGKKLHEVNLFNAKVLHVNKILNSGQRLSTEQKNFVMESIDKARSIGEVKMVFETIVGSIKTNAAVNESRNVRPPKANASGARTTGTPKQDVLSESVDRAQGKQFSRVQELAGLLK